MRRASRQRFFWSALISCVACIELNKEPPDDGPTGGRAGASGSGGSAEGGAAGEGGGASGQGGVREAGAGGVAGPGGTSGASPGSGVGGMDAGNAGFAGDGVVTSGGEGGAVAEGGTSAGVAGQSGNAGKGGTAGASSGGSGQAGTNAGAGGVGEPCDIAVYDASNPPELLALSGNLEVHDPAVIESNGTFYLFHTGAGLPMKTSTDLRHWQNAGKTFSSNPEWVGSQVPAATDLWAPDIAYFGGKYHLYYSASSFGSRNSCIGHATRDALDTGSWSDQGPIVCSTTADDWNAIDPNLIVDQEGRAFLAFGSFWGGIKAIELDENGDRASEALHALAARQTAGGSIEAPYIVHRCGYYYLFVSFDYCCRGTSSTYRIMVGRSRNVLGPYTDRAGTPLLEGGGTQLVQGGARFRGPGHNAVLFVGNGAYNVYHAYDANNGGRPTLRISELAWDAAGWPVSAGP